jgi:hypothetical protein
LAAVLDGIAGPTDTGEAELKLAVREPLGIGKHDRGAEHGGIDGKGEERVSQLCRPELLNQQGMRQGEM